KASCASLACATFGGLKSGELTSLRFVQTARIFTPSSLLRRLTARGQTTNAEAFEAGFLPAFGMTN
ncbi:hypothetical protein, partial [Tannerella forsythia]|uniref:hypothetical protein n=1 Tax=Tannerella forsythia TaxID=28112 RepID=UPI00163AD4E3